MVAYVSLVKFETFIAGNTFLDNHMGVHVDMAKRLRSFIKNNLGFDKT